LSPTILRIKLLFFILFSQLLIAANAPYSYSYIPKSVYENQLFPVSIHIKHYNPKDKLNFEYDNMSLIQPISNKPVVAINQDEAFYTFYFKVKEKKPTIEIPTLAIWNLDQTYILNAQEIKVKKLDKSKNLDFCGVLASKFRVNSIKIDPYDSEHILVTLNIEANEANLEDMHILNVIDDGIENLKRDGSNINANYYFIVSSTLEKIRFSYYNTIKKEFKSNTIDIKKYQNRIINAELNPKELSFDKLKKYVLFGFTLFFMVLYLLTYDKLYLFIFVVSGAALFYIYFSNKNICIQEGASLYILPTKNSNISLRVDEQIERQVIKEYNNFYKIEYKNSITGWIKKDELCQD
jgi:hypothetical protein